MMEIIRYFCIWY